MENARNNCSAKTSAAISLGIVIFDKDKLKSIFFIRFSGCPSGPPRINAIFSLLSKINFEKEIEFKFLPCSDRQTQKKLFFLSLSI